MPHTNVQLLVKRLSPMVEKCNMSRQDADNLKIFVKSINTIIMKAVNQIKKGIFFNLSWMHLFNPLHWENNFCAFSTLVTWNHPTSANPSKLLGFNTLDHQHCTWTIKLVIIWLKAGMELKIFSTQIKGFQNLITNRVWKFSKSITAFSSGELIKTINNKSFFTVYFERKHNN